MGTCAGDQAAGFDRVERAAVYVIPGVEPYRGQDRTDLGRRTGDAPAPGDRDDRSGASRGCYRRVEASARRGEGRFPAGGGWRVVNEDLTADDADNADDNGSEEF